MDNIGNIEQNINDNIESIILKHFSENKENINTNDIIDFLKSNYGIHVTEDTVSSILSKIPFVADITNNKASLSTPIKQDKDDTNDEIHDKALDQISDHMKAESIVDRLSKYKVGDVIQSSLIKLNESDEHYHLHYGSIKARRNYIVCEINPKRRLEESYYKCKIEGTALYINIPINSFLK